MQTKTIIGKLAALSILTFGACTKNINPPVADAAPQIVIEANVTNAPGPYQVSITTTSPINENNTFPTVSGAVVTIVDNKGLYDSLFETSPGIYSTRNNWQGVPGNTYTLHVTHSGNSYTASSTMPQQVPLDSLTFIQTNRLGNEGLIEAVPNFQDPPGSLHYYRFTLTDQGFLINLIFLMDDRLAEGKYFRQPIQQYLNGIKQPLGMGDDVSLSMYCIDEATFDYFNELNQLDIANPFSSVSPANPVTNLSGGALGYFSAHTVQTESAVVVLH